MNSWYKRKLSGADPDGRSRVEMEGEEHRREEDGLKTALASRIQRHLEFLARFET